MNTIKANVSFEITKQDYNEKDLLATFDDWDEADELADECISDVAWEAVDDFCYWIAKACSVDFDDVLIVDSKYGLLYFDNNYLTFEIADCKMSKKQVEQVINDIQGTTEEHTNYFDLTDINGSGKTCELKVTVACKLGRVVNID